MDNKERLIKLVALAKEKDNDAISELISLTKEKLFFYAKSIVKDADDANEVCQESYITAFSKLDNLDDPTKFEGWLLTIARNNAIKTYNKFYGSGDERRTYTFSTLETDEYEVTDYIENEYIDFQPEQKLDKEVKAQIIQKILNNLPLEQRQVIMMYYFEDLKIKDIAECLNISESTVKSRMNYAKEKIAVQVTELEKTDDIKLYNFAPFGFFVWLLKGYSKDAGIMSGISFKFSKNVNIAEKVGEQINSNSLTKSIESVDKVATANNINNSKSAIESLNTISTVANASNTATNSFNLMSFFANASLATKLFVAGAVIVSGTAIYKSVEAYNDGGQYNLPIVGENVVENNKFEELLNVEVISVEEALQKSNFTDINLGLVDLYFNNKPIEVSSDKEFIKIHTLGDAPGWSKVSSDIEIIDNENTVKLKEYLRTLFHLDDMVKSFNDQSFEYGIKNNFTYYDNFNEDIVLLNYDFGNLNFLNTTPTVEDHGYAGTLFISKSTGNILSYQTVLEKFFSAEELSSISAQLYAEINRVEVEIDEPLPLMIVDYNDTYDDNKYHYYDRDNLKEYIVDSYITEKVHRGLGIMFGPDINQFTNILFSKAVQFTVNENNQLVANLIVGDGRNDPTTIIPNIYETNCVFSNVFDK